MAAHLPDPFSVDEQLHFSELSAGPANFLRPGSWFTLSRKQLMVLMAVMLPVLVTLGWMAWLVFGVLNELSLNTIERAIALARIESASNRMFGEIREYMLWGKEETLAEFQADSEILTQAVSSYRYYELPGGPSVADRLAQQANDLRFEALNIFRLRAQNESSGQLTAAGELLEVMEQDWFTQVAALRNETNNQLTQQIAAIKARLSSVLWGLAILALAGVPAAGLVSHLANWSIYRRLAVLVDTAREMLAGDYSRQAAITPTDEIGRLGQVFNALITQLQIDQASIQQGATERARQLETVIDISQRLIGILDLSDLLRHVVSLTKERFNFYHVHIYLFDDQRSTLLMAEGSGEVGQELKRQGHSISVNALQSLVARCAREAQVVLAEDVRQYPDWLPNLLLPNTRAEMAVPIMSGSEVLGVMDVQSDKVSGISPAAGDILQTLAGQVAVAARNARLFSQTQEALYEARRLQRLYTGQAWSQFGPAGANTGFDHRQPGLPPLQEIDTPEVALAVQQQQTVNLVNPQPASNGECAGPAQDGCRQNALATPLKLRDEIIGVLGLHDANLTRRWTDDEVALIEAVSEQMSLAIENARLFERTQRDAWRNRVVGETTAGVWASNDMQAVLRAAVAQLADKLQATEVVIQLGAEPGFKQE